jgi:hypothetical protein
MDATTSALLEKIVSYLVPSIWYKNLSFWNLVAVIITACIIVWYSWETRRLRIEAQKTNKYYFRPLVVSHYISSESGGRRYLKIKNIGKGPALNIECRISQIHKKDGYTNLRALSPNEKFNNLNVDEKQTIKRITTIDLYSKANGSEFMYGVTNKFVIIFTYEDWAGFKYFTVTQIDVIEGEPVIKKTITDEYNSGNLKNIF